MDWLDSDASYLLNQIPGDVLEYVWFEDMTDEERAEHPEVEVTGGYLKESHDSKTVQDWWDTLSEEQKKIIKSLPNFDAEIFKEITGIEVEKDDSVQKERKYEKQFETEDLQLRLEEKP